MSLTLHPVKRATKASNRWCGPAILSILTGLDTRETATLLRAVGGRSRIKGSYTHEVSAALLKLGYSMLSLGHYGSQAHKRPTLAQWSRANPKRQGTTYLMSVGHHWAIVQGRRYACGIVGKVVPLKGCPKWRARVKQVWAISRHVDAPTNPAAVVAALPEVAAKTTYLSQTADRLAVKRLAEPYGISVDDRDRDKDDPGAVIWVYPGDQWPEGMPDLFDDEHFHDDWASARKAVAAYVAAIRAARQGAATLSLTPSPTSATVAT